MAPVFLRNYLSYAEDQGFRERSGAVNQRQMRLWHLAGNRNYSKAYNYLDIGEVRKPRQQWVLKWAVHLKCSRVFRFYYNTFT